MREAPATSRCRGLIGKPRTQPRVRNDSNEPRAANESAEATEPADPIESSETAEPADPIESTEPTEPIESTEPSLATERIEPSDLHDHREFTPATLRHYLALRRDGCPALRLKGAIIVSLQAAAR